MQKIKLSINLNDGENTPEQVKSNFMNSIKSNNKVTNVLQSIADICKDNKNKLNDDVISYMFATLLKSINEAQRQNKEMIKTEDLFCVVYDVIKRGERLETYIYGRMFDCLIRVEQLNLVNLDNTADKTKILFKLIQQFWEKDIDIFNNVLIKYMFDKLNDLLNEERGNNKVMPVKAVDIFRLIYAIQEKKGTALIESVISSMFRVLGSAIELGSIEALTTENVSNLIGSILESWKINDAIVDLFTVLDKLNRKKFSSKENKGTEQQKTEAINIFRSINCWCRKKINSLTGNIILPIFQALESTMRFYDVDKINIEEVVLLFSDIWNNKENMLAASSDTNNIIKHTFGVLFFAIKRGNENILKNFKVQNIIVLCCSVCEKLAKQNKQIGEQAIKPMFAALEYALKKCDHSDIDDIELKQITDLVANTGFIIKSQKFKIATIKFIFNVFFVAMRIKDIDDEQIKKLFEAIGLGNIGLSLENNEIILKKSELKNSDETVDCSEYINLFNKQLKIMSNTDDQKQSRLNIENPNQENENKDNKIEIQKNKQTECSPNKEDTCGGVEGSSTASERLDKKNEQNSKNDMFDLEKDNKKLGGNFDVPEGGNFDSKATNNHESSKQAISVQQNINPADFLIEEKKDINGIKLEKDETKNSEKITSVQRSVDYQDILNKIEQNWKTTHAYAEDQYEYANDPLYNLVLFLKGNNVPFSVESRQTVNNILAEANSGNVFNMTAENMVLIVEQINKSIYSGIVEDNNREIFWHKHKSVKSYFYKSDFVNNLLYSFIQSASNNNKVNNYSGYTAQAAVCVRKLISEIEDDKLFYGQNKDRLIDALDSSERDNAAALCRLMYVKNLSVEDALASIKNILKSMMEYKFKERNDFISVAYCKCFCAQIDKLKLNNGFDEQTNQIINSANAFFEKDFVPDLDEIKEFLPEFKMPDRYISPERLRQMALSNIERENSHLVDEQRRLKNEVTNQKFDSEDDVDAWEQHYKKLIEFYDAFQTKDVNSVDKLTQGQKDYAFLCSKAEIFKSVMESCCKEEHKFTRREGGKEYLMTQRVKYYYDNIQIVNNVTQKIIAALKSNGGGEKSVAFWFINLLASDKQDKQRTNTDSLQIIDEILSVESQVDENTKFTILRGVKDYFENKAKDLDLKYKDGSTEDFDKAVSDFLATSKNDLKALEYLVQKGIIEKNIYEQYKIKLDDATDLNLIITTLYWFINLLGAAISFGQWSACVRAAKSPEKVRTFNRIPKSLDIEPDQNNDFYQ